MEEFPDIALAASYAACIGAFLALRGRHGFWAAYALGFAAAFALLLLAYAVLVWGPPAIVLFAMLYMAIFAVLRLTPLLILMPLLHGALLWRARRAAPPTGA
jgi:hypothetical protein